MADDCPAFTTIVSNFLKSKEWQYCEPKDIRGRLIGNPVSREVSFVSSQKRQALLDYKKKGLIVHKPGNKIDHDLYKAVCGYFTSQLMKRTKFNLNYNQNFGISHNLVFIQGMNAEQINAKFNETVNEAANEYPYEPELSKWESTRMISADVSQMDASRTRILRGIE